MGPSWIVLIVFLFVYIQLGGFVMEGVNFASNPNVIAVRDALNVISSWGIVHEEQTFGILDYIRAPINYFNSLWVVLTYDSPVFDGSFEIVRWMALAPLLAGISFGVVVIFFSAFRRTI